MSDAPLHLLELNDLLDEVCEGTIDDFRAARLEKLLNEHPEARYEYLRMINLHGMLCWDVGQQRSDVDVLQPSAVDVATAADDIDVPVYLHSRHRHSTPLLHGVGFLGNVCRGTVHYLSQEMPLSLLIATMIMASALYLAWVFNVNHYQQFAGQTPPPCKSNLDQKVIYVGRITGMKDCQWAKPNTQTVLGASVSLEREYALSSGLMEITYTSGAKVILEGPCTFKVYSSTGGFLEHGKLTANIIEQKTKVRGQRSGIGNQKSPNPQSPIPNPFIIHTPTAIVTDLGTEFGVEVFEDGDTLSHVFKGTVTIQSLSADGKPHADPRVLRENESVLVKRSGPNEGEIAVRTADAGIANFVREFPKAKLKSLDLLDVVAGGDGNGRRRERGIDPINGKEAPFFLVGHSLDVPQYNCVAWHRLIDGVFVPDGRRGAVQLDSAGHVFSAFPPTSGTTFSSIWARAADVDHDERTRNKAEWIYALGGGEKFMPQHRGLLGLHSNVGITFDLEAIRLSRPGLTPTAFRAVAGLADKPSYISRESIRVDVWVFVDGQLKLKREKLRVADGTFNVDVELDADDRFLTLVVTDFDSSRSGDRMVFGDPVLQMRTIEENK